MAMAVDGSSSLSLHTVTSFPAPQPSINNVDSLKYPHTLAFLTSIATTYKQPDVEGADADQDIDDGQRVNADLVSKVVSLLQGEKEDELKDLLKDALSIPETVDMSQLDQNVLDLMHKHRDDISGVPFLFLTPIKRPSSRPSSRASSHSYRLAPNRPDTPNSLPASPLSSTFRRPLVAPTATSYTATSSSSPSTGQTQGPPVSSVSSSPVSSPRLLNAKAVEFRPIPRPLSAGGSSNPSLTGAALRTDTPSPDLWAHYPSRATSNLAIAAPLVPDVSYASVPRAVTPSLLQRASNIDEDYEDEFDPFSNKPRAALSSFHPAPSSDVENQWSNSSNSTSSQSTSLESSSSIQARDDDGTAFPGFSRPYTGGEYEYDQSGDFTQTDDSQMADEEAAILTGGMTPFDVLSSVFGQTLTPPDLQEALEMNGYDFESAMAWLVDKALPQISQAYPGPPSRPQQMGGRVVVVPRDAALAMRGRGFVPSGGRNSPKFGTRPAQSANRVCRYFLAGECMRADCRFSHDVDRALCRFWLRGNCAKQESCEFLHHLPKDVDVSGLAAAMARTDMGLEPGINGLDATTGPTSPPDDFPTLSKQDVPGFGRGRYAHGPSYDPGRTRFAAAVKGPSKSTNQGTPRVPTRSDIQRGSLGKTMALSPRPSPRIKLRPPTLLPTLPTGESINNLYMSYRQRALQLGAARNACLSRAADAWRRGDGAAAKRFSREGHELNAKMSVEAAEAATRLLRERVRIAVGVVRQRDVAWSDDVRDRTDRGKVVGGGLGVLLGIASKDAGAENGGVRATSDERAESLLDLHGLHANEAVDVLETFLTTLERDGYLGLVYLVVGEEKHTGTQDPSRGTSRMRLASSVREWLHDWGYPWSERDGIICVDPLTHL